MEASSFHVLVTVASVDDRLSLYKLLGHAAPSSYIISEASGGEEAVAMCQATLPDCVLLSEHLPDGDGLAVLTALRAVTDVPVILLIGAGNEQLGLETLQYGAQDYLVYESLSPERLHATIQHAITSVRLMRERDRAIALLTTLRAEAEAMQHDHEQQLSSIIESFDGRLWCVDTACRLTVGNTIFYRDINTIIGRDAQPGENLLDLPLPEEWRNTWHASYDRALAGESFSIERQTAGITMEYRFTPIRTAEGIVSGVTVFGRDRTQHKRTEAELYATERKLGTLFQMLPVGISILDAERTVVYANPALHQILRLDQGSLVQGNYQQRQYLRPDGTPMEAEDFASMRAFREHQSVTDVETGIMTEAGEIIWTSVSAAPVDFPDWRVVVTTTDITARKQAEQALEAERALLARRVAERTADLSLANAELARAARLKDEFLASMSHELRTPLNSILLRSEALQEALYGPVTNEQVGMLRGIEESGRHLLTLINDILDLSKIEAGRLELERVTVDVDLLGTMALRMVAQTALVKRITLTSRFDGRVQLLDADERRLKQILVNLLSNAVKFTPDGGEVGLEVRGNPEQQTATFTVWDTGIGIAAEDLPKLFQPFVQLDNSLNRQYTGTGLGLSLVARLAQVHGGSVTVESTLGQGSRFSIHLPWIPTEPLVSRRQAPVIVDTARPAVRQALVIEDSPTAAAQIMRYLRELGAEVEIYPYGTGTVERAISLQPDVIVLDLLLPDDHGWDILQQLKAEPRTQHIPVLVVSVVDEPGRAYALGAAAVLLKPIDRPRLEQALRQILVFPKAPPTPTALLVAPHLGRPRILLADDNEETLDSISDYIRAKGYDLWVARNGHEAIVQAQEVQPDIILMDIQMPGMDGLEAIRRIRADPGLAHIPIIVVTALAMPGDRERCLATGANAYLTKPISMRSLITMIETYRQQSAGTASDDQIGNTSSEQP